MMGNKDFEAIDGFLSARGAADLYAYLGASPEDPADQLARLISERRRWAQAQQSNRKFRDEARWVIQNMELVQRVLVQEGSQYQAHLESRALDAAIEALRPYIEGAVAEGVLSGRAEELILQQAAQLGIPDDRARRCLEQVVVERGVQRGPTPPAADESKLAAPSAAAGGGLRLRRSSGAPEEVAPPPVVQQAGPQQRPSGDSPPFASRAGSGERSAPLRSPGGGSEARRSRLRFELGAEHEVLLGEGPTGQALRILSEASGPLPVKIFADRDWLQPEVKAQALAPGWNTIRVGIDRSKLNRESMVAMLTVLSDQGDRAALSIRVVRPRPRPRALMVGLGVLALLLLLALGKVLSGWIQSDPPPTWRLAVDVDPPTGAVLLDGELVSSSGAVALDLPVVEGAKHLLRVELDGFQAFEQRWEGDGSDREIEVHLELLQGALAWRPGAMDEPYVVDSAALASLRARDLPQLRACLKLDPAAEAEAGEPALELRAYVSPVGEVVGIEVQARAGLTPASFDCAARLLRAWRLPLGVGDYGSFDLILRPAGAD